MKKIVFALILIIFVCLPTFAAKKYYIKNDIDYDLQFLCFSEKECYSLNANIIEVKNKKFVGFGAYHYYDLGSYKHDKKTNTYSVDVLVDRDPSTDLDVCNKCPFDRGNITHLIFSLIYKPFPKKFKATYKGFVSSEDIVKYENGKPISHHINYLDIYYNNNANYIKDLKHWLNYFNKDVLKKFGTQYSSNYDVDIKYIIPYYISNKVAKNTYNVQYKNNIQNTNFINKGYLCYDAKSYNYNAKNDVYTVDIMDKPDIDNNEENIKCPYGEGLITHVIYSTEYSPTHKYFKVRYKGFMCSTKKYDDVDPTSYYYIYNGVYYDDNPYLTPKLSPTYFRKLLKEKDKPSDYNYFGIVSNIENNNSISIKNNIKRINIEVSSKIRDFDIYEPIPKNLEDEYVKKIPQNQITNFKFDLDKALKHILYDKITYNNKTLKQMLLDFDKKSNTIYLKYLHNPQNTEQNKLFIEQLKQMSGTVSFYPDVIIEQVQPYIAKYDLGLEPGAESDTFLYKYYIEKYHLKYSKEFKELLELKENVYSKLDIIISKISNEF